MMSFDWVILLGLRSFISLLGLIGIVVGSWFSERQWDDWDDVHKSDQSNINTYSAPAIVEKNENTTSTTGGGASGDDVNEDIENQGDQSNKNTGTGEATPSTDPEQTPQKQEAEASHTDQSISAIGPATTVNKVGETSTLPQSAAPTLVVPRYPPSNVTIGGYALLASALILDDHTRWGQYSSDDDLNNGNGRDTLAIPLRCAFVFLVVLMGIVHTSWVRRAMLKRSIVAMKYIPLIAHALGWTVLGLATSFFINPEAPTFLSLMGGIAIGFSPVVLWWSRKRGDAFEKSGGKSTNSIILDSESTTTMTTVGTMKAAKEADATTAVFSAGGPMLSVGALMYWMGFNAVYAVPEFLYLPLYATSSWAVGWMAATAIVVATHMIGHAHDEQHEHLAQPDQPDTPTSTNNSPTSASPADNSKDGTMDSTIQGGAADAISEMIHKPRTHGTIKPKGESFGCGRHFFSCCHTNQVRTECANGIEKPTAPPISSTSSGVDVALTLGLVWFWLAIAPFLDDQYAPRMGGLLTLFQFLILIAVGGSLGALHRAMVRKQRQQQLLHSNLGQSHLTSESTMTTFASLRKRDDEEEDRWILITVSLFGALTIVFAVQGPCAVVLGGTGSAFLLAGLHYLHYDSKWALRNRQLQKQLKEYEEHKQQLISEEKQRRPASTLSQSFSGVLGDGVVPLPGRIRGRARVLRAVVGGDESGLFRDNDYYTVYSYGAPLFALGVFMLAWGLSIP